MNRGKDVAISQDGGVGHQVRDVSERDALHIFSVNDE